MATRTTHQRRMIVLTVLSLIAIATGLLVGARYVSAWTRYAEWASRLSLIKHSAPADPAIVATRPMPYRFRGNTRFAEMTVTETDLRAAKSLPTADIFSAPGPVRQRYLRDLVAWQSETVAVDSIARDLRRLAESQHLDSDEYVDLMAAFVQDIPYGEPVFEFGLPVEVAQSGTAVCTDKSVLLAALLKHEGYASGIWVLDRYNHVATAVRGAGDAFGTRTHENGGGYIYVETTRRAYVGEIPSDFGGAAHGGLGLQLVTFGPGTSYTSDPLNAYVVERGRQLRRRSRSVDEYDEHASHATGLLSRQFAEKAHELRRESALSDRLTSLSDDPAKAYALITDSAGR